MQRPAYDMEATSKSTDSGHGGRTRSKYGQMLYDMLSRLPPDYPHWDKLIEILEADMPKCP